MSDSEFKEETSIDSLLTDGEYEIWSPFNAYEAAATLQAMLDGNKPDTLHGDKSPC